MPITSCFYLNHSSEEKSLRFLLYLWPWLGHALIIKKAICDANGIMVTSLISTNQSEIRLFGSCMFCMLPCYHVAMVAAWVGDYIMYGGGLSDCPASWSPGPGGEGK